MGGGSNQHDIELEAVSQGGAVRINVIGGDPAPVLERNSGAHQFDFNLTDRTGLGVRFKPRNELVDAQDNLTGCPNTTGTRGSQISGVTRSSDTRAGFVDNNSNRRRNMPVSYRLKFECNDASKHPIVLDPTITNGGRD